MRATYFSLRRGMVIIAIALPIVLAAVGYLLFHVSLRESLSAYYCTPMRDYFVGTLVAIGVCLYLYKGFSDEENIALNCSGALALGIAFFPLNWNPWNDRLTPHGICAVLFFVGIAWVSLRCARQTVALIRDVAVKAAFERKYKLIGYAMVASPVIAYLINAFTKFRFWAEVVAILVFAYYWFTKSRELVQTGIEEIGNGV